MDLWRVVLFTMSIMLILQSRMAFRPFAAFGTVPKAFKPTVTILSHRFTSKSSAVHEMAGGQHKTTTKASPPKLSRKSGIKTTSAQTSVDLGISGVDPKFSNHPILSILNEDQIRAATSFVNLSHTRADFVGAPSTAHASKVTMVLAGAGSGKTRVLVHRIAYLLEELNVNPNAILATTFTNKAAREIKERIHALMYPEAATAGEDPPSLFALLDGEDSSVLPQWLGTFHSLCYRILLYNGKLADMEGCNMIDEAQQKTVVKKLMSVWEEKMDSLNLEYDTALKNCLTVINRHKDNGRRASVAKERFESVAPLSKYDEEWFYQSIYEIYEKHCIDEKLIDFNEVLLRTYELFLRHPEVLQRYRRQFQYIHVDEFQDTNGVQYGIVRLLIDGPAHTKTVEPAHLHSPSLFVVGDDDQAIYGFRGAKPDIMQQVGRDYPQCALVKLEQNYRSTHTILRAANSVINMNKIRLGKSLWTGKDAHTDEKVHVFRADNEFREAEYIASEILKRTSAGPDANRRKRTNMHRMKDHEKRDFLLSDIAILVRKRIQIMTLERALLQSRIPYRIRGGHSFYQREEVQHVLMYLKLIENRHNNLAFQRVVNFPPRGITAKVLAEVEELAAAEGLSLWDAAVALTQRALDPVGSLALKSTPRDCYGEEEVEAGSDSEVDTPADPIDAAGDAKAKKPQKLKAKAVPKAVLHLADFLRTIDHIQALTDRLQVQEAVKVAMVQSGVHSHYVTGSLKPTKQAVIYAQKVQRLSELAALVDLRGGRDGAEDLDWVERYSDVLEVSDLDPIRALSVKRDALDRSPMQVFLDEAAFDEDHVDKVSSTPADRAVQIFTIHGVKGLEFPVVFLCGAEEGILPFENTRNGTVAADLARLSIQESPQLELADKPLLTIADKADPPATSKNSTASPANKAVEESRRLFYVALTRAREVLYITHAASRQKDGISRKVRRSMFLDELDQDAIAHTKL